VSSSKTKEALHSVARSPGDCLVCFWFCGGCACRGTSESSVGSVVDEIIRSALERELGARLDFYAEFLDTARWPEGEIQIAVHDFLMQPKAAQRAGYCSTHILEASIAGSISHCASSTTLTFSRTNSIPGNLILHASMSVISCYRIASSAFRMS